MSKRRASILALVTVAAITAAIMGPLAAQGVHGGTHATVLGSPTGAEFTDQVSLQFRYKLAGDQTRVINSQDPSRVVVAEITVDPNAQFPWHTHPGPVIVTVAEGHLTYVQASDCVHRPYPAGTAFIDPGRGNVHTAFAGSDGAVLIATFFEISDTGAPLSITQTGYDDVCEDL